MFKQFEILNNVIDVKSLDKIFDNYSKEYELYGKEIEKYTKAISLNNKKIPVDLVFEDEPSYRTSQATIFFEDENIKYKIILDNIVKKFKIFNTESKHMYDIKQVELLISKESSASLNVELYSYVKNSEKNNFNFDIPLHIDIQKTFNKANFKYKDSSIGVKFGRSNYDIKVKGRRIDFDNLKDAVMDTLENHNHQKIKEYKTQLNLNNGFKSKTYYFYDKEKEMPLVIEKLNEIKNNSFLHSVFNKITNKDINLDMICDINNYAYQNTKFRNQLDPRISIHVYHRYSEMKLEVYFEENFKKIELGKNKVSVKTKEKMNLDSLLDIDFNGFELRSEEMPRYSNELGKTYLHYNIQNFYTLKFDYNQFVNKLINEYSLSPRTLNDLVGKESVVRETLEMLSLEKDNKDLYYLSLPFEKIKEQYKIIKKEDYKFPNIHKKNKIQ